MVYLVSACLLGVNTRYDGNENLYEDICNHPHGVLLVPVCPEQLGGLPTPRPPVEISGGSGLDIWEGTVEGTAAALQKDGTDVTENFLAGAQETLKIARLVGAEGAILKTGSPSCGKGYIRNGTFQKKWKRGDGVTVSLLEKEGIKVYTEENLPWS